jgi:hypothetical protein
MVAMCSTLAASTLAAGRKTTSGIMAMWGIGRMSDMREIKFRAWDKTFQCFMSLIGVSISDLNNSEWITEQYTGLKDKNGREIYEGDIVHIPQIDTDSVSAFGPFFGVIKFTMSNFGLMLNRPWAGNDSISIFSPYDDRLSVCEVIGNIHENQELLEAKNADA